MKKEDKPISARERLMAEVERDEVNVKKTQPQKITKGRLGL